MNRLIGLVFNSVVQSNEDGQDSIKFYQGGKLRFELTHLQDCCEHVYIESVVGDLADLEHCPILVSEESSADGEESEYGDSSTWTFYKLATVKGYVDIRFYGSSNGYYGESASLIEWDESGNRSYY